MTGFIVLAVGLAMVAVALVVAVGRSGRREIAPSQAAEAARRHAGNICAIALVGLLGGLVLGGAFVSRLPLDARQGLYLGLVPASAGLVFAGLHAMGELTWPRPTGTLRRAALTRRTVADVTPIWLRSVVWAWATVGTGALVLCGLAASDDGRSITHTFTDGSAGAGPFPGWFYGVPLLAAFAVVVLAAEGVLRFVARRPAVMDTAPEWDLALRRLSAHRVLRGVQLVLGLTTTGVLVLGGSAAHRVATLTFAIDGVTTTDTDFRYSIIGAVAVALGLAVALTAVVLALVPGTPATLSPATSTPALGVPTP